jgi:ATP-dependent DNA helicase RecG
MSYHIVSVRRENVLELPEDALREAVVNAVCHRDYFEKGARVMVEIFDDRVDIISPGGVCKGITSDNFGTISITRNSTIATLLHRSHYIEQMGTGIKRMRNATREAKVAEPEFDLSDFFRLRFGETILIFQSAANQPPIGCNRPRQPIERERLSHFLKYTNKRKY